LGIRDWFRRGNHNDKSEPFRPGRQTAVIQSSYGWLAPLRSRTANVLETLRSIPDEADALEYLRAVNPDVSMAVWNFIRLSNQGHEMTFEGVNSRAKGKRLPEVEKAWREFASRINALSNSGLDGLIDQLHYSAFMRGAQAVEVEVAPALDDVVDVYPVMPQTIMWKWDKVKGKWIPHQIQPMNPMADLETANFYWVPTDPDIDDPRGNLVMGSVLQAIDFQMQVLQDMQAVIHNQGWPRYDVELVLEKVMTSMPPSVKGDPKKQREWISARVSEVQKYLRDLKPDDSFVHTDDVKVGKTSTEATRGLDVRAIFDGIDQQMMSGAKQLSVFMNRNSGVTESWGTVQFRIFTSGIASIQRGSKRLLEEIARLWLRTQGIQAIPHFTHEVIDWQNELDKANVALLQQQYQAIAQLMGWQTSDEAASASMGKEKATGTPSPNARVSFSQGGVTLGHDDGASGRSGEATVPAGDGGRGVRDSKGVRPPLVFGRGGRVDEDAG
jgi:hypothetical protein